MGYTTNFQGSWTCTPALNPDQVAYLKKFNETRRMKRDPLKAVMQEDPLREAVGLPLGDDAEHFVGGGGYRGQGDDNSVLDHNASPATQPGLWCQWMPSDEGDQIEWDEGEKFYSYIEWIKYMIDHFFTPWNILLNGTVKWSGEEDGDLGKIDIKDNEVSFKEFDWSMLDEPGLKTYTEGKITNK